MLQKGKLENLKHEINRYKINILGIVEVCWKDKGDFLSEGKRVIYSGGEHARGWCSLNPRQNSCR